MKVKVIFSEVSKDEAQHLAERLADIKGTHVPDDPLARAASMEEVYAINITREVEAYVERDREARVAALRDLGAIVVQLPAEVQDELRRQAVEAAREAGIDLSPLEGQPPA